jgi:hypothetical protein
MPIDRVSNDIGVFGEIRFIEYPLLVGAHGVGVKQPIYV